MRNVCFELLVYIKFFSNYGYYLKIIYIPEPLNTSNAETYSSNFILKYSTTNNNSISSPLLRVLWAVSYSTNFLNSLACMKLRRLLLVYSLLDLYSEPTIPAKSVFWTPTFTARSHLQQRFPSCTFHSSTPLNSCMHFSPLHAYYISRPSNHPWYHLLNNFWLIIDYKACQWTFSSGFMLYALALCSSIGLCSICFIPTNWNKD